MKFKDFTKEKPKKDGDYWYKSPYSDKPRIARWNNNKHEFQGDADRYGAHGFVDPTHWSEIEYPEL